MYIHVVVFCVILPIISHSLVHGYQHFVEREYFHLQSRRPYQKT